MLKVTKFQITFCLNPRKIPSQERSRITFNIILEAAAHILEASVFNGFKTNIVAEKAGVSIQI